LPLENRLFATRALQPLLSLRLGRVLDSERPLAALQGQVLLLLHSRWQGPVAKAPVLVTAQLRLGSLSYRLLPVHLP
jgi:hypothetical protein